MALNKLLEVSNLLRVESNPDKQSNLVSLSLKYVELVDRINKSIECKSEKK
jgi:hypothetical protein